MKSRTLLETRGLGKSFGLFHAVSDLNLSVREFGVHGLIGPNGAGKTTCFNLITHELAPSRGKIIFEGRDITKLKTHAIAQRGIYRSFQMTSVFAELTVRENFYAALMGREQLHFSFWKSQKRLKSFDPELKPYFEAMGIAAIAETRTGELSYGERRIVELSLLAILKPRLLLLDEPSSGIGASEIPRLVTLIQTIGQGRTVLMVEHNLDLVAKLCDRISVLKEGRILTEGSYAEIKADPRVQEAYLGKEGDLI